MAIAIRNRQLKVVKLMKSFDFDVNRSLSRFEEPPLIFATQGSFLESVVWLLSEGADVNRADGNGSAPVCTAAAKGDVKVLQAMIDAGASVEDNRFRGVTPLMSAASANKLDAMNLLFDHGSNIEAIDDVGATALIRTTKCGSFEAVEWLVNHKAKLDVKDSRRNIALDWAEANGHQEIVKLLKAAMER